MCLALDFHFYAAGKLEFHQSVDNFGSGVVDVDKTLVAIEFELLAALLIDESRAVHREDALVGGQWNGSADNRAYRLYGLYDFLGRLVDETVVVRFKFDANYGIHILGCIILFEKVYTALALCEHVLGDRVGNFRVV